MEEGWRKERTEQCKKSGREGKREGIERWIEVREEEGKEVGRKYKRRGVVKGVNKGRGEANIGGEIVRRKMWKKE